MSLTPSSPRLPSPPPTAEIQIGPKSPSMNSTSGQQAQQREQGALDTNARRRVHPGTKSSDMAAGPPLIPLNELDSAFQLQEHLAALHYQHTSLNTQPITRDTAHTLATPPAGIDRTLWLYELCRFLIGQCNGLLVGFLFDTPPCSAATCPEMRASEWQFLCAVHESPKSCCAIDYCCHTLDWAANVVTNPKLFPSRFVAPAADGGHNGGGGYDRGGSGGGAAALKNLVNVFRRLHRIFAHAWFQHRGVFWSVEAQTGLYVLFKTVCDLYDLLPAENYKLPPEAEGLEPTGGVGAVSNGAASDGTHPSPEKRVQQHQHQQVGSVPTSILRPGQHQQPQHPPQPQQRPDGTTTSSSTGSSSTSTSEEDAAPPVGRTSTRRHVRSSPSTGSAVTTVPEADEDDASGAVASRLRDLHISAPETVPEEDSDGGGEPETADVPVIVMHGTLDNVTPQAMKPEEALPPVPSAAVGGPFSFSAEEVGEGREGGGEEEEGQAVAKDRSPTEPKTAFPDDDAGGGDGDDAGREGGDGGLGDANAADALKERPGEAGESAANKLDVDETGPEEPAAQPSSVVDIETPSTSTGPVPEQQQSSEEV